MKDAFEKFQAPDRGRFGDNEMASPTQEARSNLVDLDLILHNDNPSKKAIAVSLRGDTPFKEWVWLPRSLIEYEKTGIGVNGSRLVRVTLPRPIAAEKGILE
ncbi:MAG TPA: hypothetical protein VKW08_07960 [Xanthobacteraceae bacterium]|nr:hypothetical protein [Xanthobacteraceae bacterium]